MSTTRLYPSGRIQLLTAIDPDATGDMASPRNPLRGRFADALGANDDAARSAAEALVGSRGVRAYCELIDLITEVEG